MNRQQDEKLVLSFPEVKAAVREAVPVFAAHMKSVAKENGCKAVYEWYELDRIDDLFCGTESGEEPIDKALKAMGDAAWDAVEKYDLHFMDAEGNRDDHAIEEYVEEIVQDEVRSRLIGRFGISTFAVAYPTLR